MRLLGAQTICSTAFAVCLNPYSTGNEVVGFSENDKLRYSQGLNPYSTGNEVVGACEGITTDRAWEVS